MNEDLFKLLPAALVAALVLRKALLARRRRDRQEEPRVERRAETPANARRGAAATAPPPAVSPDAGADRLRGLYNAVFAIGLLAASVYLVLTEPRSAWLFGGLLVLAIVVVVVLALLPVRDRG